MRRRCRITPRAFADLEAIARFTRETWGAKQRDASLGDLERRFRWLSENPLLGKSRPDIRDGHRSYPQGAEPQRVSRRRFT